MLMFIKTCFKLINVKANYILIYVTIKHFNVKKLMVKVLFLCKRGVSIENRHFHCMPLSHANGRSI